MGPEFLLTHTLYRQVQPKFCLTFGRLGEEFVRNLGNIVAPMDETATSSDTVKSIPSNLFLLPHKEYG